MVSLLVGGCYGNLPKTSATSWEAVALTVLIPQAVNELGNGVDPQENSVKAQEVVGESSQLRYFGATTSPLTTKTIIFVGHLYILYTRMMALVVNGGAPTVI